MPEPAEFHFESLGGGYRPTAEGTVLGKYFSFRVMAGHWQFLVGHDNVASIWFHSSEIEFEFSIGGECNAALWESEASPLILQGVKAYLDFARVDSGTQCRVLALAQSQLRLAW
jgi:hypothetical protein